MARSSEELAELEKQILARIDELSRKLCPPGCDDILRIRALFDALEQIRDMRTRSQAKHDGSSNNGELAQSVGDRHWQDDAAAGP